MYLPFFLTSSRIVLLERLHAITRTYLANDGWGTRVSIAPAGPQGVGKSLYCYLIASYAAVNRFPLIYIPRITTWAFQPSPGMRSLVFMQQFVALNKHWFPDGNQFYRELEAIAQLSAGSFTTNTEMQELEAVLMDCLWQGFPGLERAPRFTVLDEHNELFRCRPGDKVPLADLEQDYFRPFCNWVVGGVTVLCGSAHSEFLSSMPGGTSNSIVELQPFTEDETVAYLTSEASPGRIPDLTDCQAREIFSEYGGIAGILDDLKQSVQERLTGQFKDLESALADIRNAPTDIRAQLEMKSRFERYCSEKVESDLEERHRFTYVVERWLLCKHASGSFTECMLDTGMFYNSTWDGIFPINKFATKLMLERYAPLKQLSHLTKLLKLAVRARISSKKNECARRSLQTVAKTKGKESLRERKELAVRTRTSKILKALIALLE